LSYTPNGGDGGNRIRVQNKSNSSHSQVYSVYTVQTDKGRRL